MAELPAHTNAPCFASSGVGGFLLRRKESSLNFKLRFAVFPFVSGWRWSQMQNKKEDKNINEYILSVRERRGFVCTEGNV